MTEVLRFESKIQAARAEIGAILTRATAERRALTDEERIRSEAITADLEQLETQLKAEQRQIELDRGDVTRTIDRPAGGATHGGLGIGSDTPSTLNLPTLPARTVRALDRLFPGTTGSREAHDEQWHATVAAALGGTPLSPGYLRAIGTEGVPSEGGFAVPTEVAREIFTRAAEESVWLRIGARLWPMETSELLIPALDDDDESGDAEAELAAAWTAEGATATAQTMKLRSVSLYAHKLMLVASCPNELADDSASYLPALEQALSRAIAKRLDRAILAGNGAGKPLGILAAPATITVGKEIGQAVDTLIWANVTKMWAALAPGSHERSFWLMNPTCLPQALSLCLQIGVGGAVPRGVFEPAGVTGYQLLGRPVVITSRLPVLGEVGDVMLVDPTQLAVGLRRSISIERSQNVYFTSDSLGVRAKWRGDAKPLWSEPRTTVDGSSVSAYVVLEAR